MESTRASHDVDFEFLWNTLTARFRLGDDSLHGPDHWARVERHGIRLTQATEGADLLVVRLFAVFHDAERINESVDPEHGRRAAELVDRRHGEWFRVSDAQLSVLRTACKYHADGDVTDNPTIGCCWDADRLDLPRVGIEPHRDFMSTETGRNLSHWR
jgi:uncharacterized protein